MRNSYIIFPGLLIALAMAQKPDNFEYMYPMNDSKLIACSSEIILRPGSILDPNVIQTPGLISVTGSQSGKHSGKLVLATDNKTIIFKPVNPFSPDETVEVSVKRGFTDRAGKVLPAFTSSFTVTSQEKPINPYLYLKTINPELYALRNLPNSIQADKDSLPQDFPDFDLTVTGVPGSGYLFISPTHFITNDGYNLMIGNNGDIFYSQRITGGYPVDFKVQPNGTLTFGKVFESFDFGGGGKTIYYMMDNAFSVIDSFQMGNGYIADFHEFKVLPNGHALLLTYDLQQVDMSKIVEGGNPGALVAGTVIQELDLDKNVIFQWRSWDHYDLRDSYADLTQSLFDGIHINSIEFDLDNNLLLSALALGEITKINRQTGEIIWRMGGKNNQFTFINESETYAPLYFMYQHDVRRLSNGNIVLFDGGDRDRRSWSRAVEYQMDETNMTATKVWDFRHTPDILSSTMGSAQRLSNGNTLIGWGMASMTGNPAVTEVDPDGNVVMELKFNKLLFASYRAMRFEWEGGLPAADVTRQELHAGNIYIFDTETQKTGVTLKINNMSGIGYNEAYAKRYLYGPKEPEFINKAPIILPVRVVMSQFNIPTINADIYFDADFYQFSNPDSIVIYHREFEGRGLFLPLSTVYNPVTNEIKATMTRWGEFIFAYPDFKTQIFQPLPVAPVDSQKVDQTQKIVMEWTPVGYAADYDFQLASDASFTNLIVDTTRLTEARYILNAVPQNTRLYWHVRTRNEAGASEWSVLRTFQTVEPYILILVPNGGEKWQIGGSYFIEWEDNIEEDVIIELYQNETFLGLIDTSRSTGGYSWEVPVETKNSYNYKIMIRSTERNSVFDISDQTMALLDSVDIPPEKPAHFVLRQNKPNPFTDQTTITYELSEQLHVKLEIFNILGQKMMTVTDGIQEAGVYTKTVNTRSLPSGIYFCQLQAGDTYIETIKMILIR